METFKKRFSLYEVPVRFFNFTLCIITTPTTRLLSASKLVSKPDDMLKDGTVELRRYEKRF